MARKASSLPPQTQPRQPGRESVMRPRPDFMPRYEGSERLAGKTAIVTGGDSGIGRAVAVLFAREGAELAIIYLEENDDALETRKLAEAEGATCIALARDLGQHWACREAVKEVVDRFGKVDILVNNCAEQHSVEDMEQLDDAQLERTFRTNLFSYVYMIKEVLPHMGEEGSIINCTSVTAYRGSAHLLDYSATKGAIVALTRSLAKSLAERGIRVNGVAPGPIWTPLIPASFDAEEVAKFGTGTPLGRPGQPNEVAPSFLFLACRDASYMTGQVLHPNGGEIIGG